MKRADACFPAALSTIFALVTFIALEATCVVLAQSPVPSRNTPVTAQASELVAAGRTEEAKQLLQSALAARPADLDARLALGDLYLKEGQDEMARQQFREAFRLHPNLFASASALAGFYVNHGDLSAAEAVLAGAVRLNPHSAAARMQFAFVLAREHKYSEARTNIQLVSPPSDPAARVRYFRLVAAIAAGAGDSHAAARAAEQALHAMPEDRNLQLIAAIAEEGAEEWRASLRNALSAFESSPTAASGLVVLHAQLSMHTDFNSTLRTLNSLQLPDDQKLALRIRSAELLATSEQHAEAAGVLQEAVTLAAQDEALRYKLAVEQYRAGQFDAALSTLDPMRKQKDTAEAENLVGDIEEARGDAVAAVHSYQKAVDLNPHEEQYWLSLGGELLKYQTYEPALLIFQQAAKAFPDSPRVYLGLGMAAFLREQFDDSVTAFLHAAKLDPQSELAFSYLGATQDRREDGPSQVAIDAICSRADSRVAGPVAVCWCGALLFRKGYLARDRSAAPEAIRRLHIAAKVSPGDPVATCSLGRALAWTEQWADARGPLEECVKMQPNSSVDHFALSRDYRKLGLMEAAQAEGEMTRKTTAETDQRDEMAKKFVYEMPGKSGQPPSPK